jgi:hypothetical protein
MTRREIVPALERLNATRIVATPAALDAAAWPQGALVLRIAPDEAIVTADVGQDLILPHDPHAIVVRETGFAAAWVAADEALAFLERSCEWELPGERPAFAQGAVAGLPVKLWLERDRVLFIVHAPFAVDLEERFVVPPSGGSVRNRTIERNQPLRKLPPEGGTTNTEMS